MVVEVGVCRVYVYGPVSVPLCGRVEREKFALLVVFATEKSLSGDAEKKLCRRAGRGGGGEEKGKRWGLEEV